MRLIPILLTILNLVEASPSAFVDPNCPDYDLSLVCVSQCEDELLQCVSTCSSSDCLMECNRAAFACGDSCPCHTDCIDGCQGCDNPICFCNEKCPLGCPCDNYDCDLPDKKAILTLYSGSSSKPPVLIQPNGGVTENFEFKINDDTEVYQSCSATLNGDVFVFGGYSSSNNRRRQISKIVGCELKRIGDLYYDFINGACGTYSFPEQRILLCFSSSKKNGCESYDGVVFHNQADAKNQHYRTTLARIDDAPLAVGGSSTNTNKAEIFDVSSNSWTEVADYPYHDYISDYATVTTAQGALIIGGWAGFSPGEATVACYNNVGWSRLDDLQSKRYYPRAIINGDKVYVIGGSYTKYTEIWSDDEGSKSIKLADPQLDGYTKYPELFLVDTSFCVKP